MYINCQSKNYLLNTENVRHLPNILKAKTFEFSKILAYPDTANPTPWHNLAASKPTLGTIWHRPFSSKTTIYRVHLSTTPHKCRKNAQTTKPSLFFQRPPNTYAKINPTLKQKDCPFQSSLSSKTRIGQA